MKTIPVASFIILALVWLESSQLSFFIAFLMVFPPVYLGVLTGIGQTDPRLLEMAKVFQVPFRRQVRYLYLPAIAPHFRSAVSVGLGLCWKSGIAAEVIGLPDGSMGERLYMAKVYFLTPELFAWTAVIVAVSVLFEKVFLRLVDKALGKAGGSHAP
jgi:NitT/TauT family transport system permease protein